MRTLALWIAVAGTVWAQEPPDGPGTMQRRFVELCRLARTLVETDPGNAESDGKRTLLAALQSLAAEAEPGQLSGKGADVGALLHLLGKRWGDAVRSSTARLIGVAGLPGAAAELAELYPKAKGNLRIEIAKALRLLAVYAPEPPRPEVLTWILKRTRVEEEPGEIRRRYWLLGALRVALERTPMERCAGALLALVRMEHPRRWTNAYGARTDVPEKLRLLFQRRERYLAIQRVLREPDSGVFDRVLRAFLPGKKQGDDKQALLAALLKSHADARLLVAEVLAEDPDGPLWKIVKDEAVRGLAKKMRGKFRAVIFPTSSVTSPRFLPDFRVRIAGGELAVTSTKRSLGRFFAFITVRRERIRGKRLRVEWRVKTDMDWRKRHWVYCRVLAGRGSAAAGRFSGMEIVAHPAAVDQDGTHGLQTLSVEVDRMEACKSRYLTLVIVLRDAWIDYKADLGLRLVRFGDWQWRFGRVEPILEAVKQEHYEAFVLHPPDPPTPGDRRK